MSEVSCPFRATGKCHIMHRYFRLTRLLVDKVDTCRRQGKVVLTVQFSLFSTAAADSAIF